MLFDHERKRDDFFDEVVSRTVSGDQQEIAKKVSIVIVTHTFPTCLGIIKVLARHFNLLGVIPKRASRTAANINLLEECGIRVFDLPREQLENPQYLRQVFAPLFVDPSDKIILLDIGGYFAEGLRTLEEIFEDRLLGIVEDTENGHQKYEGKIRTLNGVSVPVVSVARSPLKDAEDYWVGKSIVFSTEVLLRSCYTLLTNLPAAVIGYGKIGKSIAKDLSERNVRTLVVETDPVRKIEARSRGFETPSLTEALQHAGFVFSATGQRALGSSDLLELRPGAFLASVTSSEDEWPDLQYFIEANNPAVDNDLCRPLPDSQHIVACNFSASSPEDYCYVLNKGNAVNFLHGAVCAEYIYLIQAEIVRATCELAVGAIKAAPHGAPYKDLLELEQDSRKAVADIWQEYFISGYGVERRRDE